jgi:type VI secretion system FHA domain protein
MFLTLEAHGANAAALGSGVRKTFSVQGGTIGRRPGNDWVLPDPHVSSRHARVRNINGTFFLEDNESANGVYVNGNRLHAGEPYPLKDADAIFIDPFDIRASITMTKPGAVTEMFTPQPAAPMPPVQPAEAPPLIDTPPRNDGPLLDESSIPASVDPLDLLGGAPAPQSSAPTADDLGRIPIINEPYRAPSPGPAAIPTDWSQGQGDRRDAPPPVREMAPPPAAAGIPQDWTRTNPEVPPPKAAPPPHAAPARPEIEHPAAPASQLPAAGGSIAADFDALLRGAGVADGNVSPAVMAQFGEVLRVVVEGLMEVLRARGEIKSEFRVQQTTFKPRENNPLKFSANVEDALHNLLVKRNAAYLDTREAFQDAFVDVRHHQIAMLAGVRAAFESMLDRFEPQRLREQFDSSPARKSHLGFGGRGRYWELYEDYFRNVTADADDTFRRLFGDRFGQAYEAELERLRAAQRRGGDR